MMMMMINCLIEKKRKKRTREANVWKKKMEQMLHGTSMFY